MSRFSYKAFNASGELQTGSLLASSKSDVLNLLGQKNLTLVKLLQEKEQKEEAPKRTGQKVNSNSIFFFTRQLHSLIKAGVPLTESIELIISQSSDEKMQVILKIAARAGSGRKELFCFSSQLLACFFGIVY